MMTGLFTFDGPMFCDCNGVYCNTTITNKMLNRYFVVAQKLYLLIRTIHVKETYKELNLTPLETGDRIEVIELPNLNSPIEFLRRKRFNSLIASYITKIDLIFLRIPSVISNMVAQECRKIGKPYLVEVGGCAWDSYFNHSLIGKIVAPLMYLDQKRTVRNAKFASYVTSRWLQNRYPTNGRAVVASNVYLDCFDDDNIERRIFQYKRQKPNRYKLGTVAGVDVRYKGQEFIIRAVAELKKQGFVVDYELVGSGSPAYLRALAEKLGVIDQVHFLGLMLHEKIWNWLDQIDIYAQPSKQEGLPRAVIEAMNRGCMAIGSNVAGIPELLEDDMVFNVNNVKEIVSIIKKLIEEKDHECRIRRNYAQSHNFELAELETRRKELFTAYQKEILDFEKGLS